MTKSFGEGERPQWSTFAGPDSPRDQAAGGRSLRAGSLDPSEGSKQQGDDEWNHEQPDGGISRIMERTESFHRPKGQRFGTHVVELASNESLAQRLTGSVRKIEF